MTETELVPHLFKNEYSKLVSVLTKIPGIENISIAEDIAGETFLLALEIWPYKGIPANPAAWLYTVAKNKTSTHLKRQNIFDTKISESYSSKKDFDEINIDFSDKNIADSQLQMLFTLCNPAISVETQICLSLRILCGLGIDEIADAFVTNKETIHKRLQRGKEKLSAGKLKIEMPDSSLISERSEAVLLTIYLLFSEGYYSESNCSIIRQELCIEALNLNYLLLNNPSTNNHASNSLMSLMCFQTSRINARKSEKGDIILYDDQDRTLWDSEFIEKGFYYLQQASQWEITSKYYFEAGIAYWHTVENDNADKWESILKLYDGLQVVDRSSIISLNRIWAYSKVYGVNDAIIQAEKLQLKANHFYHLLLAELYKNVDIDISAGNYEAAIALCKTGKEKELLVKKLRDLNNIN